MLELRRGTPPSDWDDMVRSLGGTLFHSTIWSSYLTRPGLEPWFFTEREGGVATAAALGLFRESSRPLIGSLFRALSLTAHPCASDRSAARIASFLAQVEHEARRAGCAELHLDSWMSAESPFLPADHGYTVTDRLEFLVDLREPKAALWSAMKKDQRERIRHLEREGVTVSLGTERRDLDELREMQESTQERRSRQGLGYALEGDEEFYGRIFERLVRPGAGRLFLAKSGAQTVAGIFFHVWNGRAYSMLSGSTPDGYRLGAQTLLYWRAVERFQEEGLIQLNRGGVSANAATEGDPLHGLYRFKTRLGTKPVLCRSGRKELRPGVLRLQALLRRLAGIGRPSREEHA